MEMKTHCSLLTNYDFRNAPKFCCICLFVDEFTLLPAATTSPQGKHSLSPNSQSPAFTQNVVYLRCPVKYAGLPWWLNVKESTCQCRRLGFDPWIGKIPWKRKWPPTPAFLPGKSHGQKGLAVHGVAKGQT